MDSKIRIALIALAVLLLCPSCKQNNWLDWKVQNEMWLDQNKTREGVMVSKSGLQYKVIADPTPQDARPNTTSTIICDYAVKLINGYQIDGGYNVTLSLATTIPGFSEGCHKIHCNGDIELYIPAYLGYDFSEYQSKEYGKAEGIGTEGTQSFVPPYSTLIYTVHICGIAD